LITFMSLGLFILSIYLLRGLFPVEKRKKPTRQESQVTPPVVAVESNPTDEEVCAVISAALAVGQFLDSQPDLIEEAAAAAAAAMILQHRPVLPIQKRSGLGARLEEPRGRYWQPMNNSSNDGLSSMQ